MTFLVSVYPELSTRLGIQKMDNAAETGTVIVAMDCPGCILQMKGLAKDTRVAHTIELLWEAIFPV